MTYPISGIGMNLAGWLANAKRQNLTRKDFKHLYENGYRWVRLPFNPEYLGMDMNNFLPRAPLPGAKALLDAVYDITWSGLRVVVDLHTSTPFRVKMEDDQKMSDAIFFMWKWLANRLRYNPMVVLQLLNEPQYYRRSKTYDYVKAWADYQWKLWEIVRLQNPDAPIVLTPCMGSLYKTKSLGLEELKIVPDKNTYYGIPFYEPMKLTHGGDGTAPYSLKSMEAYFKGAIDYAATKGLRLFVPEFGTRKYGGLSPEQRLAWHECAVSMFNKYSIPAAIWDYADTMGVTDYTGNFGKTLDGANYCKSADCSRTLLPGYSLLVDKPVDCVDKS
jgi:hypothetical protein